MRYALSVSMNTNEAGIAIVQRVEKDRNSHEVPDHWLVNTQDVFIQRIYHLRHLEKMKLDYKVLISRLNDHMKKLELEGRSRLIVDITVSSNTVIREMRDERLLPTAIRRVTTSNVTEGYTGYAVPDADIATSLKVIAQSRRIKMPGNLSYVDDFQQEMQTYDLGVSVEEQKGEHPVLFMAVAQALWYFNKVYRNNQLKGNKKELARDFNTYD